MRFWEWGHTSFIKLGNRYTKAHKNGKNFKPLLEQVVGALECHWSTVLHCVNKYSVAFAIGKVEHCLGSGKTHNKIVCYFHFNHLTFFLFYFQVVEAKNPSNFKANQVINFNLDHCGKILHHSQKWQEKKEKIKAKPKKDKKIQLPISDLYYLHHTIVS